MCLCMSFSLSYEGVWAVSGCGSSGGLFAYIQGMSLPPLPRLPTLDLVDYAPMV